MAAAAVDQPALPASVYDAPAPPPLRPRTVLVGSALASAGAVMFVLSMLGIYLARRADAINAGKEWLPKAAVVPLTQPTMIFFTMVMSSVTILWAAHALRIGDRSGSRLALLVTLVLGFAAVNQATFLLSRLNIGVRTEPGLLILVITSAWIAWLVAALGYLALMAFRALGGQERIIPDGVNGAAVVWISNAAIWFVLWIAIYISK
jgi:heme/copper-type cytochrome/quinol oxidase subunit 3